MRNEELIQRMKELNSSHEGLIPYLYRDTSDHGWITVGKGHLLSDITEAKKMPFYTTDEKGKRLASVEEIEQGFQTILTYPHGQQYPASYYKGVCPLFLQSCDIERIETEDLTHSLKALQERFSGFPSFPSNAQLGLLDMSYNLGQSKLESQFPKFCQAVEQQDWTTAGRECHRRGIAEERNQDVTKMFMGAARDISIREGQIRTAQEPNPRLCAELCQAAYHSHSGDFPTPQGLEVFLKSDEFVHYDLSDRLLEIMATDTLAPSHSEQIYQFGYVAIAYYEPTAHRIFIADAGTNLQDFHNFTNISNVASDLLLALFKTTPIAHAAAEKFRTRVIEKYRQLHPREPLVIWHIGHSLGGVHGQLSGIEHPEDRVITFESPGVRELLPRAMQASDYPNVTNYVMYENAFNSVNTRVGTTYRLHPSDADETELHSTRGGPWLLKCHGIETCINAFDVTGRPLKSPDYLRLHIEKVTPQLTFYGRKITPELLTGLLQMYAGKHATVSMRTYSQSEIDAAAWNALGYYRFSHEVIPLGSSKSTSLVSTSIVTQDITNLRDPRVFCDDSNQPPQEHTQHRVGLFRGTATSVAPSLRSSLSSSSDTVREQGIVMNLNLDIFARPTNSKQPGLLSGSLDSQRGLSKQQCTSNFDCSLSLATVGKAGILFAPYLTFSYAVDFTPGLVLGGLGFGAGVGLAALGIQKIIEHQRWENLSPGEKAVENLNTAIDFFRQVNTSSLKFYAPWYWDTSWTELEIASKEEIERRAHEMIASHSGGCDQCRLRCLQGRAILYTLHTNDREAMEEWKNHKFDLSVRNFTQFRGNRITQILDSAQIHQYEKCRHPATELLRYDQNNPLGYYGKSLAAEKCDPRQAIRDMSTAIRYTEPKQRTNFKLEQTEQLLRIADHAALQPKKRELFLDELQKITLAWSKSEPKNLQALTKLCATVSRVPEFQKNQKFLQQVNGCLNTYLKSHPEAYQVQLMSSANNIRLARFSEAKTAIQSIFAAKDSQPHLSAAHVQAGYIAQLEKNNTVAKGHFEEAIKIGITDINDQEICYRGLAIINYNEAVDLLSSVASGTKDSSSERQIAQEKFDASSRNWDKYLQLCSGDVQAQVGRAYAELLRNENEKTLTPDKIQQVISNFSTAVTSCERLINCRVQVMSSANTDEIERWSRENQDSADILLVYVEENKSWRIYGKESKGSFVDGKEVTTDTELGGLLGNHSTKYVEKLDGKTLLQKAVAYLDRAQLLSHARMGLANAYCCSEDGEKLALAQLEIAVRENPENFAVQRELGRLHVNHALVCYAAGKVEDAKAELQGLIDSATDKSSKEIQCAQKALAYIQSDSLVEWKIIGTEVTSIAVGKFLQWTATKFNDSPKLKFTARALRDGWTILGRTIAIDTVKQQIRSDRDQKWDELCATRGGSSHNRTTSETETPVKSVSRWEKTMATVQQASVISRKIRWGAQATRIICSYLPENKWVERTQLAANKVLVVADITSDVLDISSSVYLVCTANPQKIIKLCGVDVNILRGTAIAAGLASKVVGYVWDRDPDSKGNRGKRLSESKLVYVSYDVLQTLGSDWVQIPVQLIVSHPAQAVQAGVLICKAGSATAAYVGSLGTTATIIISTGGAFLLVGGLIWGGYKLHQHYKNVDLQTKLHNAKTLMEQKKYDEALLKIREAKAIELQNPEVMKYEDIILCEKHLQDKKYAEVIAITSYHLVKNDQDIVMLEFRGRAYCEIGTPEAIATAEQDMRRVIAIEPKAIEACITLAKIQLMQGKHSDASQSYSEAQRRVMACLDAETDPQIMQRLKKREAELGDAAIGVLIKGAREKFETSDFSASFVLYQEAKQKSPSDKRIADEFLEARCIKCLKEEKPAEVFGLMAEHSLTDNANLVRILVQAYLKCADQEFAKVKPEDDKTASSTAETSGNKYLQKARNKCEFLLVIDSENCRNYTMLAYILRREQNEAAALTYCEKGKKLVEAQLKKVTTEKPGEEKTLIVTQLTEQLRQNDEVMMELSKAMDEMEQNLRQQIGNNFKAMRENMEKNDRAFSGLNKDMTTFKQKIDEVFGSCASNIRKWIEKNASQILPDNRVAIEKMLLEDHAKLCEEVRLVLGKQQKDMELYQQFISDATLKSDGIDISEQEWASFQKHLSSAQLERLQQSFKELQATMKMEWNKKLGVYEKQLKESQTVTEEISAYLSDAKREELVKEIRQRLSDIVAENISKVWHRTMAECAGICMGQTLQAVFDYYTDSRRQQARIASLLSSHSGGFKKQLDTRIASNSSSFFRPVQHGGFFTQPHSIDMFGSQHAKSGMRSEKPILSKSLTTLY